MARCTLGKVRAAALALEPFIGNAPLRGFNLSGRQGHQPGSAIRR